MTISKMDKFPVMRMCVPYVCKCACVRACVRACMFVRVCVHVCARVRASVSKSVGHACVLCLLFRVYTVGGSA